MIPVLPRETASRRVTIERVLRGRLGDVWELGTTKASVESWWRPEGFATEFRSG